MLGALDDLWREFEEKGVSFIVSDDSTPNPTVRDTMMIANAYLDGGCDAVLSRYFVFF